MRPSATIVIPAWNEWDLTRQCLETLRPTLGIRDQVVVVDNGSVDGTAAGLRRYPWVTVVSHPENLGFAAGCNSGAAVATGDVVVFLNNDTRVPSRWLDGLLSPFADGTVGATGPRSNFVKGPQLVPHVDYDPDRTAEMQRFARAWRQEHRGRTTVASYLIGFCIAVRRDLFEQLGGFDTGFGLGGAEDDDLCMRIVGAGYRLVIADECFVHHDGHRTFEANGVDRFALQQANLQLLTAKHGRPAADASADEPPLVSACMIVKDEEQNLAACLGSLRELVDEVVVYDTGSTDGTVALARELGATVVEGYWDNDFGRARNASLAHCRGAWVLHVDADEVISSDVAVTAATRALLRAGAGGADALTVEIANLADDGQVAVRHTAGRLFRRDRGRWTGALHEQIVAPDGASLSWGRSAVTLVHSGYVSGTMDRLGKRRRNIEVAREGVRASDAQDALALINLGRALVSDGQGDEAVPHFETARTLTTDRGLLRQAWKYGAEALLASGRSHEALTWIASLRGVTSSTSMPDFLEARAHVNLVQPQRALPLLQPLGTVADEDVTVPQEAVDLTHGYALTLLERWSEAAELLGRATLGRNIPLEAWGPLVESHWRSGRSLRAVVDGLHEDQTVTALGQVLNVSPEAGDRLADALWDAGRSRAAVIAFVSRVAPSLPLARLLEWSGRFRSVGQSEHCPLLSMAASSTAPGFERLRACAVLVGGFGDDRAVAHLAAAAAAVPVEAFRAALLAVDELCPRLLAAVVTGVATNGTRSRAMAAVLTELGAGEQADALLAAAG